MRVTDVLAMTRRLPAVKPALLALTVAAVASAATVSCRTSAAPDLPGDRLVFQASGRTSGRNTSALYAVNADGTGLVQLAKDAFDPAVSADGRRIAFTRADGVWVMDAKGANQRRLLEWPRSGSSPTWAAGGTALFFLREDGIYRMRADGSNVRRVLKEACLADLAASPTSRELAYVAWPSFSGPGECDDAPPSVIVSDPRGRNSHYPSGRWAEHPAWSPDGKRLAFSSRDAIGGPPWGIYIVRAGEERRLTARTGPPSWSPDGSQVAFASGDVWSIGTDGKGLRRITHTPKLAEVDVAWLPAPRS
jgi:Tol biopolymer transport system component